MSATRSSKVRSPGAQDGEAETDSIPRIRVRDMMLAIQALGRDRAPTLEELRLKLSLDRHETGRTANYSVARDVAGELARQGYADVGPLPKDARAFEKKRDTPIVLTGAGRELAATLRTDASAAYATVLKSFYRTHPYFRRIALAVTKEPILTPVVTSTERHLSPRYASTRRLAADVAQGQFDASGLMGFTATRLQRKLTDEEVAEIASGLERLVEKSSHAAQTEVQTEFARKFLSNVNEIVVPAVLRRIGLGFDYNTLRRLWKMGEEFQTWWSTSAHREYDAWLTFATANLGFSSHSAELEDLSFENGLDRVRDGFLDELYEVYRQMQASGSGSIVKAWELRAAFCYHRRCAPGVFNRLFEENYNGSETYEISKDFPRNKPPHEDPLVLGGRSIGLIRITRR